MKTVKAAEAEVGKLYYSPKGVPCTVVEVRENDVLVKSNVTGNQIEVPKDQLLFEEYDVTPETAVAAKEGAVEAPAEVPAEGEAPKVKKEKKPKAPKEPKAPKAPKVPKEKKVSPTGVIREILLGAAQGQLLKLEEITAQVTEKVGAQDPKQLLGIVRVVIFHLLKAGKGTFTYDKTQNGWTRN